MIIQDHLDRLCENARTCVLAAYVDLESGLSLRWSAAKKQPRELMDLMSAPAVAGFSLVRTCTNKSNAVTENPVHQIVYFSAGRAEVFAGAPSQSEDVVCAVTQRISDVGRFLTDTSATISRIVEED